jgi:2-polyprenyl-3-methyl-5-hydroxy-6-metoxy-1,4-benzoquinol methylase
MTTTTVATTALDERLVEATIGTLELFGVYLGSRLGLYEALDAGGPTTAGGLAERAGIDARYALEWLEQQAVAGFLDVDDATDPLARTFSLPPAHRPVLLDPVDPAHLAPMAPMVVGIAQVLDEVVAAYRTGDGVPYARYGAAFRSGQGGINRPAFSTALVEEWLPAVPGLVPALERGGRIADVGCGQGWSALALARAFPRAEVLGIDLDVASIEDARRVAAAEGVAVRFETADAAELAGHGPFDAVLVLETLHDLARPVEVLRAARSALGPGGVLVVADEGVADTFTAPGDELERMMYGWSITHCLPAARVEEPSAAIGTVIRESTVRALAAEAGFGTVEVLPVDGGFFRLYLLRAG